MEDRFNRDIGGYQDQITELQAQLDKIKSEMADRLREYQELLAVKLGTLHRCLRLNLYVTYIKFCKTNPTPDLFRT